MSTHWTRWQFKLKASSSCTLAERKGLLCQVGLCQACCQDEVTADKCHAHTPLVSIICGGNNTNQCCAVAVSVLKVSIYNGLCIFIFFFPPSVFHVTTAIGCVLVRTQAILIPCLYILMLCPRLFTSKAFCVMV